VKALVVATRTLLRVWKLAMLSNMAGMPVGIDKKHTVDLATIDDRYRGYIQQPIRILQQFCHFRERIEDHRLTDDRDRTVPAPLTSPTDSEQDSASRRSASSGSSSLARYPLGRVAERRDAPSPARATRGGGLSGTWIREAVVKKRGLTPLLLPQTRRRTRPNRSAL
jgi:hypothetical protein